MFSALARVFDGDEASYKNSHGTYEQRTSIRPWCHSANGDEAKREKRQRPLFACSSPASGGSFSCSRSRVIRALRFISSYSREYRVIHC